MDVWVGASVRVGMDELVGVPEEVELGVGVVVVVAVAVCTGECVDI